MTVERCELAPGFSISRVLTGLWQIADMERGGRTVDQDTAAAAMRAYVDAGLTSFDMADHYGTSEEIAGRFSRTDAGADAQMLTKWVPEPGPVTREDARAAVERSLRRLGTDRLDLVASGIKVVSNQVCFSLLDRRPLERMSAFCEERGIRLLAYGTLAGAVLVLAVVAFGSGLIPALKAARVDPMHALRYE